MDKDRIKELEKLQAKIVEKVESILDMDYAFTENAATDEDEAESIALLNLVKAYSIFNDILDDIKRRI